MPNNKQKLVAEARAYLAKHPESQCSTVWLMTTFAANVLAAERSRVAQAAGTENIEEICLLIRQGKRHQDCVAAEFQREPVKLPSSVVADRISGKD